MRNSTFPLAAAILLLATLASPGSSGAQTGGVRGVVDECPMCAAALAKDIHDHDGTFQHEVHILKLIDQDNYGRFKTEFGAGLEAIGEFGYVNFTGDYSQFSESRKHFFTENKVDETTKASWHDLDVVTSEFGYSAFTHCIDILCGNTEGFTLYKAAENKDDFIVGWKWAARPGSRPVPIQGEVRANGILVRKLYPNGARHAVPGGSALIYIHRIPGKMMTVVVPYVLGEAGAFVSSQLKTATNIVPGGAIPNTSHGLAVPTHEFPLGTVAFTALHSGYVHVKLWGTCELECLGSMSNLMPKPGCDLSTYLNVGVVNASEHNAKGVGDVVATRACKDSNRNCIPEGNSNQSWNFACNLHVTKGLTQLRLWGQFGGADGLTNMNVTCNSSVEDLVPQGK